MTDDQEIEVQATDTAPVEEKNDAQLAYEQLTQGVDASVVDENPTEDAETKEARARDEKGRFAPKTEAAPEVAAPVEDKKVSASTAPPETVTTQQTSSPADGPPPGWLATAKSHWSQLPPDVQASVAKREREISDGARQWSEEKRRYEEVVSPLRSTSQRYGISEQEGIQRLLAANDALERNPVQAIQALANQYGVDLSTLNVNPSNQRPTVDPFVSQLHQKVSTLEERLEQQAVQEAEQVVNAFRSNPDHKYYDDVRADMSVLLKSGVAVSLEDAYDKAVWQNPHVRDRVLADREADQEAKRAEAIRAKTEAAKRASVSVRGAPSIVPPVMRGADGDQSFAMQAYELLTGRV